MYFLYNTEYEWMYMYNYIEISSPINGIRLLYTYINYANWLMYIHRYIVYFM